MKKLAYRLARLCSLSYKNKLEIEDQLGPKYDKVKFFDCGTTEGIALARKNEVLIIFRGTKVEAKKAEPKTWLGKLIHWISGSFKTIDFGDIRTDLDFKKEDFHEMGEVHRGFKKAFDQAIAEIMDFVLENKTSNDVKLYISGHSLGGALAVLLAAYLRKSKIKFDGVFTFGQPRVFSHEAASYQATQWDDLLNRFVNSKDIVTRVPLWLQGFAHFGRNNTSHFFDYRGNFYEDLPYSKRLVIVVKDIILYDIMLLQGVIKLANRS